MSKMLYRLNGEPECDVHQVELFPPKGMDMARAKAECKLFEAGQIEDARKRGWVSHAAMMDFLFLGGNDAEDDGEEGGQIADLSKITDKGELEAIGRKHGVEVDKRKSISAIRQQVAEAIAAKAGEGKQ